MAGIDEVRVLNLVAVGIVDERPFVVIKMAVFHACDHPEALAFDDRVGILGWFIFGNEGVILTDEFLPEVVDFLDLHYFTFERLIFELDAFGLFVQACRVVKARLDLLVDVAFAGTLVHLDFPLKRFVVLGQGEGRDAKRKNRTN